ncbi:MAG: hypothetical protein ACOH5I_20940 [Oligoflexus sp.]
MGCQKLRLTLKSSVQIPMFFGLSEPLQKIQLKTQFMIFSWYFLAGLAADQQLMQVKRNHREFPNSPIS